jgi:hypothetical protein
MNHNRVVVDLGAQHAGQLLRLRDLDQHRPVERVQHKPVRRVVDELEPPVPVHGLGHVHEQRVWHRITGEPQ